MGGINSLSGLGKVSVDYRPQIGPDALNVEPQPQQGEDIIQINGIAQANAKSVVRQLDALLLNAALKSVSASAATKMAKLDGKLHSNFLTVEESEELDRLAKDATDKLMALDNFSGRDLSKALMTKSGDLVWRKGVFGGMSGVTTAVKAAATVKAETPYDAKTYLAKVDSLEDVLKTKDPNAQTTITGLDYAQSFKLTIAFIENDLPGFDRARPRAIQKDQPRRGCSLGGKRRIRAELYGKSRPWRSWTISS